MLRETLVSLERRLDATRFFRIHRSAIVNLSRVREIRLSNKGDHLVTLEDNTRLRTTRARRWELEQLMEHVTP
jgi:two-component system LytT family response regulator